MPFVPAVLGALDTVRAVGGLLGLRIFTVKTRVRTWTGERPGIGTSSDVDTVLTNSGALPAVNVRCRYLTQKEIIASGGLYRDRDMRVGRMTPSYAASIGILAGGFGNATLDPAPTSKSVEIFWNITGGDMPTGGEWFDKIGEESTALHYEVTLRAGGKTP